jgi:flavodoxin
MKKLVVFYSLDGNTRFVGQTIAKKIDADIFELKPRTGGKLTGFSKYFFGGMQAIFGLKPPLAGLPKNIDKYGLIILGGPVWASRPAPVINSFVSFAGLKGMRLALFCCNGGGKSDTYFAKIRSGLKGNSIIGTTSFQDPLAADRDEIREKIADWAKKISKK